MTEAETIGIVVGHQKLESYDAEKFRNIYSAIVRFGGEKKDVRQLWPLPTDGENSVSKEYIEQRNKDAFEIGRQLGIFTEQAEC